MSSCDLARDPHIESLHGEQIANMIRYVSMDEGRKRVLLIAASILAARNLAKWDGKPSPYLESTIANSIFLAEKLLKRIDALWPGASEARNQYKR